MAVRMSSFLAFAIVCTCFLICQFPMAPHGDTLWLTLCAQKWLDGGRYYYDFSETNPPASILLHVPIVWINSITSLPIYRIPFYYYSFLFGCSAFLCWGVYRSAKHVFQHNAYIVLLVSILTFSMILPGVDFGQRDYLLFMAVLPFVAVFVLKTHAVRVPMVLEITCVFWAALFLLLKPHYYVVVIGLFFYRVCASRRLVSGFQEPAFYMIGLIACAYLLCIYLFFPDFLTQMLPDVVNIYISTMQNSYNLNSSLNEALVLIFVGVIGIFFVKDRKVQVLYFLVLFFSALFLVAFYSQGLGFSYHFLPARILLYSGVVLLVFGVFSNYFPERAASTAVCMLLIMFSLVYSASRLSPIYSIDSFENHEKVAYIDKYVGENDSFVIFLGGVSPAFYYTNGTWGSRFVHLWFLGGITRIDREMEADALRIKYQSLIIEDLKKYSPNLIMFQHGVGREVFEDFMSGHDDFQSVWMEYHLKETKVFPRVDYASGTSIDLEYDVYCRGDCLPIK